MLIRELLEAQTALPQNPATAHWIEAAGLVAAYGVAKFIDLRQSKKHTEHTKTERTKDMDERFTGLRSAIDLSQQSNVSEFGKMNTRLDKMDGSMEVVKSEVEGLRGRELNRLERAATPPRGVRKR